MGGVVWTIAHGAGGVSIGGLHIPDALPMFLIFGLFGTGFLVVMRMVGRYEAVRDAEEAHRRRLREV